MSIGKRWRFKWIPYLPRVNLTCFACSTELEPPFRTPHTVYVKSRYRIAGQDYCRDHIIRAAAVAGVITEVRAGAGPGTIVVNPIG